MWNDKISPEVADLYESSSLGSVPGVLVDQEEDDLLQSYGDLTEDAGDVFRQLELLEISSPYPARPDQTRPDWPDPPVWRSWRSCGWPGWRCGHCWSRQWRPFRDCRGRCRWRSSPCVGPRVLTASQTTQFSISIFTKIVQVRLGRLRGLGRPSGTGNLGITIAHLLWKYSSTLYHQFLRRTLLLLLPECSNPPSFQAPRAVM